MLTIARLFGKSPFATLLTHVNKVATCMEKLSKLFEIFPKMEVEKIERLSAEISNLEHEADLTKNDIRNHLPKNIFMPIDRGHFLAILSIQDSVADQAEKIAMLFTMRPLDLCVDVKIDFQALYKKNVDVFWDAKKVIAEIDELLESSFGGIEAEKVKSMVEQIAYKQHECSKLQEKLLRQLYTEGNTLSAALFFLHLKLIEEIGSISYISERLANRIRMVLETK